MEQDSTVSRQTSRFLLSISLAILLSSWEISSAVGLEARVASLSAISSRACSVRPGVKLGILPRGMFRLEALCRILRKTFSPASHEDGGESTAEGFLCFGGEGWPVGLPVVGEARRPWRRRFSEPAIEVDEDGEVVGVECCDGFPVGVETHVCTGDGDVR